MTEKLLTGTLSLNTTNYIYGSHGNATPTCTEHFEIFSNYFDKNCTWWSYCNDPEFSANSADSDQTAPRGLIRVYTVCHYSVCIIWTHYSMAESYSSNLRVIKTNFWGVRIFREITVHLYGNSWFYCSAKLTFSLTPNVNFQNISCNHSKIWTMWLYHRVQTMQTEWQTV